MFYDDLLELCKINGITPAKFREDTGIKQSTMASWKTKHTVPKFETLIKIADYFDVTTEYFTQKQNQSEHNTKTAEYLLTFLNLPSKQEQKLLENLYKLIQHTRAAQNLLTESDLNAWDALVHSKETARRFPQLMEWYEHMRQSIEALQELETIFPEPHRLKTDYDLQHDRMTQITRSFRKLNAIGKKEAIDRTEELTQVQKFRQQHPNPQYPDDQAKNT